MRVVLDANVLVSAFVFPGGSPEHVYRLAVQGRIELIITRPLLLELGRVLSEKFDKPREASEAIAQITSFATLVDPTETVTDLDADPDDNRVLEAALEGEADAIVSGDRHLLRLKIWRGIPIRNAADFIAEHSTHRTNQPRVAED